MSLDAKSDDNQAKRLFELSDQLDILALDENSLKLIKYKTEKIKKISQSVSPKSAPATAPSSVPAPTPAAPARSSVSGDMGFIDYALPVWRYEVLMAIGISSLVLSFFTGLSAYCAYKIFLVRKKAFWVLLIICLISFAVLSYFSGDVQYSITRYLFIRIHYPELAADPAGVSYSVGVGCTSSEWLPPVIAMVVGVLSFLIFLYRKRKDNSGATACVGFSGNCY